MPGPPPPGLERARIDRESGLRAPPGGGGVELWFVDGTAPAERADAAIPVGVDLARTARDF